MSASAEYERDVLNIAELVAIPSFRILSSFSQDVVKIVNIVIFTSNKSVDNLCLISVLLIIFFGIQQLLYPVKRNPKAKTVYYTNNGL